MSDLIDRQRAIMHFVKASKNYECGMFDLKELTHELWQLPSVQPEPKKGRWEYVDYGGFGNWHCTACGKIAVVNGCENYCPNCGAKMDDNDWMNYTE